MSEINVQLKNGEAVPVPDSATVAEALKKLDRDLAKQALAAKVGGREVDLTAPLDTLRASNGEGASTVQIEPIVPETRDGLEVLRHSTAHLLAAAVLDLFPGGNEVSKVANIPRFSHWPVQCSEFGPEALQNP